MTVINYLNFRKNLKEKLKFVGDKKEAIVVSSKQGKCVVVMAWEEYNSIQETMHLTSTLANHMRLHSALNEMQNQ